jgi:hypothetical protein
VFRRTLRPLPISTVALECPFERRRLTIRVGNNPPLETQVAGTDDS